MAAERGVNFNLSSVNNEIQYADENNNENIENRNINNQEKLTYELPADYIYEVLKCICERPREALECGNCHQYFHGRIKKQCRVHPSDLFLMDFGECPFCLAPTTGVKKSNLSWDEICKIENAELPSDGDDL